MENLREESKGFLEENFLNQFSSTLISDGEHNRALEVYQELYDLQTNILFPHDSSIQDTGFGSKHIKVAQALHKLGCVFGQQKDYHKARELYHKALIVYRKYYGFLHKETNAIMAYLYKVNTAVKISSIENILSLSLNYTSLQSTTGNGKLESVRNSIVEHLVSRIDGDSYILRGKVNGRSAWHYLLVDKDKREMFLEKCKESSTVDAECFGIVLSSGWGNGPSQEQRDEVCKFKDRVHNDLVLMINRERNAEALYYVLIDAKKKGDMVLEKFYTGSIDDAEYYGQNLHYGWGQDPIEIVSEKIILSYFDGSKGKVEENTDLNNLHDAARNGDVETLKYLIGQKVDVNGADKNGWTSLHHAAYGGNFNAVKYLIDSGSNVHAKDNTCNRKPVHIAARECHTSVIEFFLSKGIKINDADKNGWTPLHYATWGGGLVTVEFLLNLNADIHAKDIGYGRKPIHVAAGQGYTNIVNLFLRKHMDIESVDSSGRTPLYYSVWQGHLETVIFLSNIGANINSESNIGVKPIHVAARNGLEITEFFIRKGADVNATTRVGSMPLHYAAAEGKLEVIEFLLAKGADMSAISEYGNTPLHCAAEEGKLEAMDILIANGADVNVRNKDGDTPLNVALKKSKRQVLKMNLAVRFDMDSAFY